MKAGAVEERLPQLEMPPGAQLGRGEVLAFPLFSFPSLRPKLLTD